MRADIDHELGRYDQLGKKTADAIPNAKLYEWEGLGHLPQIESFDRFKPVFDKSLTE